MADIRCPICSKLNVPEAEICFNCGARLRAARPQANPTAGEPAPAEPAGDSNEDWLNNLRSGNETKPAPEEVENIGQPPLAENQDQDMPDWLARIRERAKVETGDHTGETGNLSEAPEWMSDLLGGASATGTSESSADLPPQLPQTPVPGSEVFDQDNSLLGDVERTPASEGEEEWVNKLSAWQAGNDDGLPAVEQFPDWLGSEAEPGVPGAALNEFKAGQPMPEEETGLENAAEHAAPGEAEPLPGWLENESKLETAETQAVELEPAVEERSAPEMASDDVEWLRDFSAQAPAESDSAPLLTGENLEAGVVGEELGESFGSENLPEWLSAENETSGTMQEPEKAVAPQGEELAHAELPEWVKEMRPIESVLPADAGNAEPSQLVEKAGPLVGLHGVLPAEDLNERYRKPPVYSAKLRVSEKQHSQASLLDSIITQESQPLLLARERSGRPHTLARILIALLFLAALVAVRIFLPGLEPASMLAPPELDDMFNLIDQADVEKGPVLLAVDYEPGRVGEMYFASAPVIQHLMAKNAQIVVLSTVPTGPALAQKLLEDAARDLKENTGQSYDPVTQTINLGYLPGGTISLIEFANLPSRAAPATLEGSFEIWNQSFLQTVKDLGGFSQVIVLTDSAETGRAWVEQVQPLMQKIPLLMVTSAQASPLLMPYVQSQQINGMVSGLLGGVIYGQWRHQTTPADVYWESYQVGILLAAGIMLIGGLISAVTALVKRTNRGEE